MVVRKLKELSENNKELSVDYSSMKEEIENVNKNQEEMKNIISEMKKKKKCQGIEIRLDEGQGQISKLQDTERNTLAEQQN